MNLRALNRQGPRSISTEIMKKMCIAWKSFNLEYLFYEFSLSLSVYSFNMEISKMKVIRYKHWVLMGCSIVASINHAPGDVRWIIN